MTELRPPYDYRREPLAPLSLPDWAAAGRRREAAVVIAEACVGVRSRPDDEARLMLPHDPLEAAVAYLRKRSTCALFGRAVMRLLGHEAPELEQPYLPRDGLAVNDVVRLGQRAGAWRTPDGAELPPHGSIVLIGSMLPGGRPDPAYVRGTGATEHVLVVTTLWMGVDGDSRLGSVDGGQPGVEYRTRRLVWTGRELWLGHTEHGEGADGRPLVGRRVVGWVDVGALPTTREAYVPLGADLTG